MQDGSQSGAATHVLLERWRRGDTAAGNQLAELVYDNLRRLASSYMRNERPSHTLSPTALVHEAYVRLAGAPLSVEDRAHFLAMAAREMRHVLVDHARSRNREKRGGGEWQQVTLDEAHRISAGSSVDMLVLQAALDKLAEVDSRKARLVDLICFGGLTTEEAAGVLEISTATVGREWRMARAWLQHELKHPESN
jgi:RNA polymerase sigma factor (TIGR02999 family)